MKQTLTCCHCGKIVKRNARIKGQRYCGALNCQQARKNKWEKNKLIQDKQYKENRKNQKEQWRKARPGYEYQRSYRKDHPQYEIKNKASQNRRNEKKQKIVKTDASNSTGGFPPGLYKILPYSTDRRINIVKTDALVVEIRRYQGLQT